MESKEFIRISRRRKKDQGEFKEAPSRLVRGASFSKTEFSIALQSSTQNLKLKFEIGEKL